MDYEWQKICPTQNAIKLFFSIDAHFSFLSRIGIISSIISPLSTFEVENLLNKIQIKLRESEEPDFDELLPLIRSAARRGKSESSLGRMKSRKMN